MSTISMNVDVDVDIDIDDLPVSDLIKALEYHERKGSDSDKKRIKEYKSQVGAGREGISLTDQIKYESFLNGKDKKSIMEIDEFFR